MENKKKEAGTKKKKWPIILTVAVVLVAAVLLYGFVFTKSGYWLIAKLTPDTPEQQMVYSSASDTARTIAEEGIVLLENDENLLPLATSAENKTRLNLFGIRSVQMIYNGGGSAATDVTKCVKLETALTGELGNFELNEDLLNLYYNFYKSGKLSIAKTAVPDNGSASEFIQNPDNVILDDLPASAYTDTSLFEDGRTLLEHAKDFSDVAIVVLGRGGNEGYENTPKELRLTAEETAMMDAVCGTFDKVVVIFNTANAMEVGFIDEYPSIKSVLWMGYPGEAGNLALAEILNGTVNPSGRMVDSWLTDNTAAITANNFVDYNSDGTWNTPSFHYTNAPQIDATELSGFFNQYSEGIYVGYKYFETRHDTDPSYNYDADVVWPFGYGISYTTFEKNIMAMNVEDGHVTVRVEVTNTGDEAGKDVLQIYYNPPYTGAIEKATVNLVAFEKTNLIQPGDTEVYSIEFDVEDMASYDYKVNKAYVLEAGDYEIMLRDGSHTLIDSETWTLGDDIIYNEANDGKRASDLVTATNQFDQALGVDDYLTREWNPDSRAFTGPKAEDYIASDAVLAAFDYQDKTDAELGLTMADLPTTDVDLETPIMLSEMKNVPYDDPKWDTFISQLSVEQMATLVDNAAWHIENIDEFGIPRSATPDGSTAIASTVYSGAVMGTDGAGITYPCPSVVAASWNDEIAYMQGTSVGNEAHSFGYNGWYAPSMNIHRTAFNGRNFEYYSEDAVLSGKTAAGVVRGATDQGVICFVKHFAMNERNMNCRYHMFVWSNEQAIREIYLKPFEIAIKEGGAMGVMSSFNFIGYDWAGGNSALLQSVLRDEWGFRGAVITDAAIYTHMEIVQMIQNGGDLCLDVFAAWADGVGKNVDILNAVENPEYTVNVTMSLQRACKNILYAVSRSWIVE